MSIPPLDLGSDKPTTAAGLPPVPAGLDDHADRVRATIKSGVEVFHDLGVELAAAKQACPHGQWLHFLAAVGLHERTAQRAMKFAAKLDNSAFVIDDVSSIREFLGDPAPKLPLERTPGEPITPAIVNPPAPDAGKRGEAWNAQAQGMTDAARSNRAARRTAAAPPVKSDSESHLSGSTPAAAAQRESELDRLRAALATAEARVDKLTEENVDLAQRVQVLGSPDVVREIESLQSLLRVEQGRRADWQRKYEERRGECAALRKRIKALEGE